MTIASSFLPSTNPAHVVRPMNGGIFHPSTETGRSLRGAVTLNTPSAALQVPGSPVICAIRLVSSAACAANGSATAIANDRRSVSDFNIFMVCCSCVESSLRSKGEVVEERHTVGLCPDADRARILERVILDREKLFPVEVNSEQ